MNIDTNNLFRLRDRIWNLTQEYKDGFTYDPAYDSLVVPDGWYVGGFCWSLDQWLLTHEAIETWLVNEFEPVQREQRLYIGFDGYALDGTRHFRSGRRAMQSARPLNQRAIGLIRAGQYAGEELVR